MKVLSFRHMLLCTNIVLRAWTGAAKLCRPHPCPMHSMFECSVRCTLVVQTRLSASAYVCVVQAQGYQTLQVSLGYIPYDQPPAVAPLWYFSNMDAGGM